MKRALLFVVLLAATAALVMAQPRIVFEKALIDIGSVESGEMTSATFNFSNQGSEKLVIGEIKTDCGCTAARLNKREFQPGEKGSIRIDFNTRGYSGRVLKNTVVASNDPQNPSQRLTMRAEILLKDFATAQVNPDTLSFDQVRVGESRSRVITITNSGNLDLIIYEVTHIPELQVRFKEKFIAPGRAAELEVVFTGLAPGSISNIMRIRTNDQRRPQMLIRIEARISD